MRDAARDRNDLNLIRSQICRLFRYDGDQSETLYLENRPEDIVYRSSGEESLEAVDSLLSDQDQGWR